MDGGIFVITKGFEPERRSARALIASAAGSGISEQAGGAAVEKIERRKAPRIFSGTASGGAPHFKSLLLRHNAVVRMDGGIFVITKGFEPARPRLPEKNRELTDI